MVHYRASILRQQIGLYIVQNLTLSANFTRMEPDQNLVTKHLLLQVEGVNKVDYTSEMSRTANREVFKIEGDEPLCVCIGDNMYVFWAGIIEHIAAEFPSRTSFI